MAKERTYLSLDKDLKSILITIQKKENYSTLNDLIVDLLEDYIINSNVKFKYQDNISNIIREEIGKVNSSVLGIYEILKEVTDE